MAQDVVAADDRLGDQLGREAVGADVADADLAHRAAEQEAVRHRAEAVLAVDGGRGGSTCRAASTSDGVILSSKATETVPARS